MRQNVWRFEWLSIFRLNKDSMTCWWSTVMTIQMISIAKLRERHTHTQVTNYNGSISIRISNENQEHEGEEEI